MTRWIDWGRASSAFVGAPLAAFSLGSGLMAVLPGPEVAFTVGAYSVIPLWVILAVVLPMSPSGARAWSRCLRIGTLGAVLSAVGR